MSAVPASTSPACPACGTQTRLERWDDVKGFGCPSCRGHCIRPMALAGFFARHGQPARVDELVRLARAAPRSPRKLRCPDCAKASYRVLRADTVELDVCADCGGLFCDAGEATEYFKRNRDRKQPGGALANLVDGADALEALIEIIIRIGH